MNIRLVTLMAALGVLLLCSVPASADPVVSDTLQACQGTTCYTINAYEGNETGVFTLGGSAAGIGKFLVNPTVVLDSSEHISDVFGSLPNICLDCAPSLTGNLAFISDPGPKGFQFFGDIALDLGGCGTVINCVPEGTGVFDMTSYLSTAAVANGWSSATFTSDSEVPEPASVGWLLGLGAIGLCAWKRRRAA